MLHSVKLHSSTKLPHALTFASLVNKINNVPFVITRRVFFADLTSVLINGSESWINVELKPEAKLSHWYLKQLSGVERTTEKDFSCS